MKYNILFFSVLLLCLCSACSQEVSEFEKKEESELHFMDNYTFPPDETELALALNETGLNWEIKDKLNSPTDTNLPNPFAVHAISNASHLVDSSINMRYYIPPGDKTGSITFAYKKQTAEDYIRFQKEEWPLFWLLAGKLFQSPEAIAELGEQCMSYYNNYSGKGQGILDWCGKQGDVYCSVRFIWHPLLEQYVLDGVYLDNPLSFNSEMNNKARYIVINSLLKELTKVSEIDVNSGTENKLELKLIVGHVEQIKQNDDILDTSTFGLSIPENTDIYKYGYLVDEAGKLPVYIVPNSLTEAELAEERLRFVYIINAPEPYCLIDLSIKDTEILK